MQAKLLRVIESARSCASARSSRAPSTSASSRRPTAISRRRSRGATFRQDLLFRLNGITLAIPPLRERVDEIAALVDDVRGQACREIGAPSRSRVGAEAMRCLLGYSWPGNIRELKNVIERAVVLCDGAEIRLEHLPLEKMRPAAGSYVTVEGGGRGGQLRFKNLPTLDDPKAPSGAAEDPRRARGLRLQPDAGRRKLGVSRRTLVSRLDQFGIPRPQKGQDDDDDPDGGPRQTPNKAALASG